MIEITAGGLRKIELPPLTRPPVKAGEAPTEELVQWGVRFYAYSLVAHVRTILSGLLELGKMENTPASQILSRHLFEWTCHACYLSRRLTHCFQRKDWQGAWDVLTKASTGNFWAQQHGDKYVPPGSERQIVAMDSIRIGELIEAYEAHQLEQQGKADAKDNYSLLSEFSHPNSACLQNYHEYNGPLVQFCDPDSNLSTLPIVNWSMIDLLMFLHRLLILAGDTAIISKMHALLSEIGALAPATRNI